MRFVLFIFLFFLSHLFGSSVIDDEWAKGETLLTFFEKNHLPLKLYYDLDVEDKEVAEEIIAGTKFQILQSEDGKLQQALIPVGDEVQIHIFQSTDGYELEITPIIHQTKRQRLYVEIQNNPYIDIREATGNPYLAMEFVHAFKNSLNFKKDLKKGDRVVIIYDQKERLGKIFGTPEIKAAMAELNKKKNYVFLFGDGEYYDEAGRELGSYLLGSPMTNARISSTFSLNRFHPVLKRYRPHFGVDYAAPVGSPIKASGNGKIVLVGIKGGYGKTIIVDHGGGYRTLYGHMSGFAKNTRNGARVKQGQVIGYVGSTGLSSGPHLHFGVYQNNKPINPLRTIKMVVASLQGAKRSEFTKVSNGYKGEINEMLQTSPSFKKRDRFEYFVVREDF